MYSPGGFDQTDAIGGSIACLNMWNSTFNSEKLLEFSKCMDHGDIFKFEKDLGTLYGEVTREQYPEAEAEKCEWEGWS